MSVNICIPVSSIVCDNNNLQRSVVFTERNPGYPILNRDFTAYIIQDIGRYLALYDYLVIYLD